jgi:hypothetical protein
VLARDCQGTELFSAQARGSLGSPLTVPLSPQRSLNCNNTYGEGPDMLRTALGESTASLDSTTRSATVPHCYLGVGMAAAPGLACWEGPGYVSCHLS